MAAGMNWGIVTLLVVIVAVLGGIAGCAIFLARRMAALSKETTEAALLAQAEASWPVVLAAEAAAEEPEPVSVRVGLKPVSTLAQHRKYCGPPRADSRHPVPPRARL